jgi:hypothetical protein
MCSPNKKGFTMKRIELYILGVAAIAVSCSNPKPQKTIENLKTAITGETGASADYPEFARISEQILKNS